jgi:site-specific recombinase XerC
VFDMIFAPATANAIGAMLEHVPDTLIGKRDHAILLIGFAAALRRSELAALRGPDLEMHEEKSLASKLSNRDKTVGAPLCVFEAEPDAHFGAPEYSSVMPETLHDKVPWVPLLM